MRSVMDDLVSVFFVRPIPTSTCSPDVACFWILLITLLMSLITGSCFTSQGLSDKVVGTSAMFTGEEEIFAFARACSRLVQMGSKEWAETAGQM